MAVFLVNVCKFNSCGLQFASLQELIRHIEESHLDYEQNSLDNISNATCLPVSCVLRIYSNRDDPLDLNSNALNESHLRKTINSPAVSLSTTPTDGSELDEDVDSDSGQSSIDSWATTNTDSAANPLLKFHQIMGSNVSGQNLDENNNNSTRLLNGGSKEFICGMVGCNKRYRSSNSLSHHRRSAHKVGYPSITTKPMAVEDGKKMFNCTQCCKTYKTSHGLKNHSNTHHNPLNPPGRPPLVNGHSCNANMSVTSNGGQIKQEMPSQVTSFVQISSNGTMKTEISPTVKETILNSISKGKGLNAMVNAEFVKLKNGTFTAISAPEIMTDSNCPLTQVSSNVEVMTEPGKTPSKFPPIISAPTLQQHLLSPIVPKSASS